MKLARNQQKQEMVVGSEARARQNNRNLSIISYKRTLAKYPEGEYRTGRPISCRHEILSIWQRWQQK